KLDDDLLDFARINVDAIDEQQILFSIRYVIVALFVAIPDVSGQQPVAAKSVGGFFGMIPIAEHDVPAAHANFADLFRREKFSIFILHADFHVGNGQPDGTGFTRAIQGVFGDDRTRFAQAITLDEWNAKFLFEALQNRHRQWRRTTDADA